MIRLLLRIFGIRDYEVCQSCETLKEQLKYERDDKKRLTDTLLNIIQPKTVEVASEPVELRPVAQTSLLFSKRRAALEAQDRLDAQIQNNSKVLAKPDFVTDKVTTERLEAEMGIDQREESNG